MESMLIGRVAKITGVGIETIRFYERSGLIDEPPRGDSRYRQYPPGVIERLRFIKAAKELGFSLKEIGELLSLRADPEATCAEVKQRAEDKIADVEARIKTLQRFRKSLVKVAALCRGQGPTSECPILDALGPLETELTAKATSNGE